MKALRELLEFRYNEVLKDLENAKNEEGLFEDDRVIAYNTIKNSIEACKEIEEKEIENTAIHLATHRHIVENINKANSILRRFGYTSLPFQELEQKGGI